MGDDTDCPLSTLSFTTDELHTEHTAMDTLHDNDTNSLNETLSNMNNITPKWKKHNLKLTMENNKKKTVQFDERNFAQEDDKTQYENTDARNTDELKLDSIKDGPNTDAPAKYVDQAQKIRVSLQLEDLGDLGHPTDDLVFTPVPISRDDSKRMDNEDDSDDTAEAM
jgi:hypothetical protein